MKHLSVKGQGNQQNLFVKYTVVPASLRRDGGISNEMGGMNKMTLEALLTQLNVDAGPD
jgi:hypothetical protein